MQVVFIDNNNKEQAWFRVESVKCLSSGRAVISSNRGTNVVSIPVENLIEIKET